MFKKGYLFLIMVVCLFAISTVSAEKMSDNETYITISNIDESFGVSINTEIDNESQNVNDDLIANSYENDMLGSNDWSITIDTITEYGTVMPVTVNGYGDGFMLIDHESNTPRYFTKYPNGRYYTSCLNEDYFLPTIITADDCVFTLKYNSHEDWFYVKSPRPVAVGTEIIVNDYDFTTHDYPFVGSGKQYSEIKIPISVVSSKTNSVGGGINVYDGEDLIAHGVLDHGTAFVTMPINHAGKYTYKVKFNSNNPTHVDSSSTTFTITSISSRIYLKVNNIGEDNTITAPPSSKIPLSFSVIGSSANNLLFVLKDDKNNALSASEKDNPVYAVMPGLSGNGKLEIPEYELPSEEGTYYLTVAYGTGFNKHDFNEIVQDNGYVVQKTICFIVTSSSYEFSTNNATGKLDSILNFTMKLQEKHTIPRIYDPNDPLSYYIVDVPVKYQYFNVTRGYVIVNFNNEEYRFPVINSSANIIMPVNKYIDGDFTFYYKRSEIDYTYGTHKAVIHISTTLFDDIVLFDENNKNITSITGVNGRSSSVKFKIINDIDNVNNNSIKLVMNKNKYISVIGNNEANFTFINDYNNKGSVSVYYIYHNTSFFVKSIPYQVSKKNTSLSINETNITADYSSNKYVKINVIDEFKKLVSGKVYSKYNGEITVENGIGEFKLNTRLDVGTYYDTLRFTSNGCVDSILNYKFEITEAPAIINFESNQINVKLGEIGTDLIKFNITNKYTNELINSSYFNINNNFSILSSNTTGIYYLKVPDKTGIYNLTLNGASNNFQQISYNFIFNITKIKPTLIVQPTCYITQNNLIIDFYYLNSNINDYINGKITVIINNRTYEYNYKNKIYLNLPKKFDSYDCVVKLSNSDKCLDIEQKFTLNVVKSNSSIKLNNFNIINENTLYKTYLYNDEMDIEAFLYSNATFNSNEKISIIFGNKTYSPYYQYNYEQNKHLFRTNIKLSELSTFNGKIIYSGNEYVCGSDFDLSIIINKDSQKISVNNFEVFSNENLIIRGSFDNIKNNLNNHGKLTIIISNQKYEFDVNDYRFNYTIPLNLAEGTYSCIAIFNESYLFEECNTTFKIYSTKPNAIISLNNKNISKAINGDFDEITVYVKDYLGNPLDGTIIKSNYHESFDIKNGVGILKINNNINDIGVFTDSLVFEGDDVSRTYFTYTFNITKITPKLILESYEVEYGTNQKFISFYIYDNHNKIRNNDYNLNVNNDKFEVYSDFIYVTGDAGEYNLTIYAKSSNKNLNDFSTNISFKINKKIPQISISNMFKIGEDICMNIYFPYDNVKGNISVLIDNKIYSVYHDGMTSIKLQLSNQESEYNCSLIYYGSKNYKSFEKNFILKIDKCPTNIHIDDYSASEMMEIKGYLDCNVKLWDNSDKIKLIFENKEYPVKIYDKDYSSIYFKSYINLTGLLDSKLKGKVIFPGSNYLESSESDFNIILDKKPQTLVIHNQTLELNKDVFISGYFENIYPNFNNHGWVSIYAISDDVAVAFSFDVDGKYSFNQKVQPFNHKTGTYEFRAHFYNSALFKECETKFSITFIEPIDYKINVDTQINVKDDMVDLKIILSKNIDTKVNIYLNNNKIKTVNIKNGVATTTINNVPIGQNTIKVEINDNNYVGTNTKMITISNPILNNLFINALDLTKYYKGSERFVVTLKDLNGKSISSAEVKISINGNQYTRTTDANGVATMAINLDSGVYNIISEYGGVKTYSTVTIKTTIESKDITKIYRNGTQYYTTFRDSNGNLLRNTKVNFNINGVFYDRTTNENGVARMNINLNPNKYVLTAINPVTGESCGSIINVLPNIMENHDLTKYYKNASKFTFRLLNDQGKPVGAGVSATLNINGVFYTRTTDANGYINMNINLNPGTYIATIMYNGLSLANTIKVLPILEAKDVVMNYRDGSKFEAKLLDGQGRPFAGQTITFNINGVMYNRITDASGVARLNLNLMAGEYIITSMYENGATIANKVTIRS